MFPPLSLDTGFPGCLWLCQVAKQRKDTCSRQVENEPALSCHYTHGSRIELDKRLGIHKNNVSTSKQQRGNRDPSNPSLQCCKPVLTGYFCAKRAGDKKGPHATEHTGTCGLPSRRMRSMLNNSSAPAGHGKKNEPLEKRASFLCLFSHHGSYMSAFFLSLHRLLLDRTSGTKGAATHPR
jgi:hypothetical protein